MLTLLIGGLLAIGVGIVEMLYRLPPVPFDRINYFQAARLIPGDSPSIAMHQQLRLGLTIPIRFAQELFGYSQAAFLLVPILAGIGLAVGVYVIGVLLFNRTVGFAAAVLTVGNSIVFPNLTTPLPDVEAATIMCWAIAVALGIRQRRRLLTATPRREILALLLVGVLLGWSYLTREYIVFCWPLIPLLLIRRVPLRRLLWVLLPLAIVCFGETIYNAAVYDDPLARLRAATVHGQGAQTNDLPAWRTAHLGHSPQWYLSQLPAILGAPPEGMFLRAALAATVIGALFSRKIAFLLAWVAFFYVPLVLLGGLLDPNHPSLRITVGRYWLPLIPAIMLSAVAGVWLLISNRTRLLPYVRRRDRLVNALAALAVLAIVAVPVTLAQNARASGVTDPYRRYAANGATQLEAFRSWLAVHTREVETIWADPGSARILKVYVRGTFGDEFWNGELKTWFETNQPAPGDYVVLYSARSQSCARCFGSAQALLGKPVTAPASWRLAFATSDRLIEVYQVR